MIDKEKFQSVSSKVSDLEKKEYEISGLDDFLTQTSGMCTVRVNGKYTFQVPSSILTDYIQSKKDELTAEISTIESQIKTEIPDLEAKVKDKL